MFFLKLFTDLRTGNHTAGGVVAQTGAVSEVDTIVWTEELLNTWDQNSFTEKPDEAEDTGPINTGLNPISEEARDVDGEGLKPNQEHERRVSGSYLSSGVTEFTTLLGQHSQEITKNTIEQRRQGAIVRRLNNIVQKLAENNRELVKENRILFEQVSKHIQIVQVMREEQNAHFKSLTDVIFKLNRVLQLKTSTKLSVAGPSK